MMGKDEMIHGVINVYKEPGFTSHDVVAKLRGILKQKKIGHMGTLDPNAVGVLPVCLGKATKLCDILSEKDKTYHATLLLDQYAGYDRRGALQGGGGQTGFPDGGTGF